MTDWNEGEAEAVALCGATARSPISYGGERKDGRPWQRADP